jgi:hypothetical protein
MTRGLGGIVHRKQVWIVGDCLLDQLLELLFDHCRVVLEVLG